MPVYNEKYIKSKVKEFNSATKTNFLGEEIPKEGVLRLHSLYNYWSCYENGKKELSTSLFRRMQIQNKEDKDVWIS